MTVEFALNRFVSIPRTQTSGERTQNPGETLRGLFEQVAPPRA